MSNYIEVVKDEYGMINVSFNDIYDPESANSRKKISVDCAVLHNITQYPNRIEIDLNEGDWAVSILGLIPEEDSHKILPISKINGLDSTDKDLDWLFEQICILKH